MACLYSPKKIIFTGISVLKNLNPAVIEKVIRYVPGQREVSKAIWDGKPVYIKKFFGSAARRHFMRDLLGVKVLVNSNFLTPKLLFQGKLNEENSFFLIFEAIEDAKNAELAYSEADNRSRFKLAQKLVTLVAEHHKFGIIQTDLYLKNFLVDGDNIYTIDGDGIRKYKLLSRRLALKNLSVLLSKFDVLEVERWLPKLLELYSSVRNWESFPEEKKFRLLVNQHRTKVASNYADKKVFRLCTDVKISRQQGFFKAVSRNYESTNLPNTIEECDQLIETGMPIKKGNTCTVSLVQIDGIKLVIKRYNIKSIVHQLNRALRPTRAAISWSNAFRLMQLGIPTAKPVALIEKRIGFLRGKAYFLSEYLDAPDIKTFFDQIKDEKIRFETVKKIVELFYRMYLLKLTHGDLKASNIKLLEGNPYLIDLDSLKQNYNYYFARKGHVRDIKRFMRNWQDNPALYNNFIEAFFSIYADPQVLSLVGFSLTNKGFQISQ